MGPVRTYSVFELCGSFESFDELTFFSLELDDAARGAPGKNVDDLGDGAVEGDLVLQGQEGGPGPFVQEDSRLGAFGWEAGNDDWLNRLEVTI